MLRIFFPFYLLMSWFPIFVSAEVTLDGTLGSKIALDGPNYQITAQLGQQQDSNLFHSFEQFNLLSHESATFSGPDHIRQVISRVTGGRSSNIDGLLRSTLPEADIFLINPAGLMFGPNAQLDVLGSFHVSTADTLYLEDGGEFNAIEPNQSLLTIAPPVAFGFLDNSPVQLDINRSSLSVLPGKTLSFIGGDLNIEQAELLAPAGRINLASLGHFGQVTDLNDNLTLSAQSNAIHMTDSLVDTSGEGGGAIYIRGGQFEVRNSEIAANTEGDLAGQGIQVQVEEFTVTEGGQLSAQTFGPGQGGQIEVYVVGMALLTGANSEGIFSGILANSESEAENAGPANQITLEVGQLSLTEGAWIGAETFGSGEGAPIVIKVSKGSLLLLNGAQIYTATEGQGSGGNIDIQVAENVTLSGEDSEGFISGIFSYSLSEDEGGGHAGHIVLEAKTLNINEGTGIAASSFGTGQGGNVSLYLTDSIILSGEDSFQKGSFIKSSAEGLVDKAGDGGDIQLETRQLHITEGGQIGSITFGSGNGGTVSIKVSDQMTLSGTNTGQEFPSGIFTNSDSRFTENLGQSGDMTIQAKDLHLDNNAKISASTHGTNRGGNIHLQVYHLHLDQGGTITAESRDQGEAGNVILQIGNRLEMSGSSIETAAERADGGNIVISSPSYLYLINSQVTTSVKAENGNGGNITLEPAFIIQDGSHIVARAVGGNGGNINISTTGIYDFAESIIDASSQLGIDGEIVVESPDININKGLIILSTEFEDASHLLKRFCHTAQNLESSNRFIVVPFQGSPPTPEDWQGSYLPAENSNSKAFAQLKPNSLTVMKVACAQEM